MGINNAPEWSLIDVLTGETISSHQFDEKPVLLFFFNIGCDGCMLRGLPIAAEIARKYGEINVVGMHSTFNAFRHSTEQIRQEIEIRDVPFPVVLDSDHAVFDAYEAEGTPHWVFIGANGKIERSIFGSQANALQRLEYGLMEQFD